MGVTAAHLVRKAGAALSSEGESLHSHRALCDAMLAEGRAEAARLQMPVAFPPAFGPSVSKRPAGPMRHGVLDFLEVTKPAEPRRCPFPWHFMAINAHGQVVPCGWWHGEDPVGNIEERPLDEIWRDGALERLRSEHVGGNLRSACRACSRQRHRRARSVGVLSAEVSGWRGSAPPLHPHEVCSLSRVNDAAGEGGRSCYLSCRLQSCFTHVGLRRAVAT